MPVLKLPFTESNEADTHQENPFECGLYRMLPKPVQEVARESVHLLEYMHMVPIEELGVPQYYPELTRKLGDLKEPNLIYPVGGGIFTHIFPNSASGRNTYISVEPLLTSNLTDVSREVEKRLLDFTDQLGNIKTDEERKQVLICILDRMSRAERKRTSGAEQNRTTERHVVKHQGPGGVRARFRQLPEVGWTSCCA